MTPRRQGFGKQKKWTLSDIREGLEYFKKLHGKYPSAQEVDSFEFLPSSRSIQRSLGGMIRVREQLGLTEQWDLRKGIHSSKRAQTINKRATKTELEVYDYLSLKFGVEFVHREHPLTDDRRSRTDFLVYHKTGIFSVDVFYARDRHSLIGCLNIKLRKFGDELMLQYPVIFLQMNKDISQDMLDKIINNKKNKLDKRQVLMTLDTFKLYCKGKKALRAE